MIAMNPFVRGARLFFALFLAGMVLSAFAANTASVTPSVTNYSAAGGNISFSVTLGYTAAIAGLDFTVTTPTGWKYLSSAGTSVPQTAPLADDLGAFGLGFAYSAFPTSPATFSFTLSYPAGMTGGKAITAIQANFTDEATGAVSVVNVANITIAPGLSAIQSIASQSLTAGSLAPSFIPVTAQNGSAPYAYAITPALPSGLSLNPATGAITGTPAVTAAAATYTVAITDATTTTARTTFSLTINSALVTTVGVGSTALTIGTAAAAFTPVTTSAGTSPYTYAITGSAVLPTGLSINANTGAISGTPTVTSASTTYTVTATDAAGATSGKTFTLVVNSALVATQAVATRTLTAGSGAAAAFVPVAGSGGTTAYTYSISPALPTALGFNPTTGAVSGTPAAAAGAGSYTVTVTDAAGAVARNSFSLTINGAIAAAQTVATKGLTLGTAAVAFTPVTVSGGTSPYTHTVAPALPTGLSLASATGLLSGTPSVAAAAANYSVTVTDVNGAPATNAFNLTVNSALTSTVAVAIKSLTRTSAVAAFTPVMKAGGTSPYSFSVSPALPTGLTLNSADGSVSGTPTAAAVAADYTVTITDGAGATTNKAFNLTVNAALIASQITAARVVTAGAAIVAFTPVTAAGGTAPWAFSVAPALPSGLSINAASGAISGNPTAAATLATYTVTVTDAAGATSSASFALNVNGPLSATAAFATYTLTVGGLVPAVIPVVGGGGTGPYTYAVAPAMPAGLSLNGATGEVSGSPTTAVAAANFTVTVTDATAATASCAVTLTINPALSATKVIAARALTAGSAAISFIPVTGAAGTAPYNYGVNPRLPASLTFDPATGAITGTAAAASAAATYTVLVGDSGFASATNTFTLAVNAALTSAVAVASKSSTCNSAVAAFTPVTKSGGTSPYAFAVSPPLPAGLTLNSADGSVSGTPTAAATADYTVTITDGAGARVSQIFTLVVNTAITTTQTVASVGPLSAGTAITGSVTPVIAFGGTSPYTFGVSPPLPASLSLNTATGAITGTPTAASSATTYTVTATDAAGATSSKTFSLTVNGPLAANVAIPAKALTAGTAATAFIPVTGGGGTVPYAYSISPALPSTLVFSAISGAITGIPGAAAGSTPYTVTITDAASGSVNASFGLLLNSAITTTLAVGTKALSVGTAALPFAPVTAVAGTPAYTFSVAPALPAGLGLSSTTGEISGTPTAAAATANYTLTVTDTVGATSSKVLALTVNSALVAGAGPVATKTLTATTAVVAFTPLPLGGGTTPYGFAVNPPLPAGLALSPTTGVITGTPTAATASAVYTVTGSDAAGAQVTQALTLTVNPALVATQALATKVLITNVVATAFTPVTFAGGTSAFVYTIAPTLPAGLSLAAATGAISGTPTVTFATTTFTVTVTDAVGATANQSFTLGVNTAPVITTQPVSASVNLNGTATFSVVATGFPAPTYQWKKAGSDITGSASATTATLTLANAQLTDEAAYTVVVTNASGTGTSTPAATLTVFVLPAITTQPAAQTILAGGNATFTVVATGKPAPTYQWRRNGNALSGAINATLNLPGVALTGGGNITVDVTNVSGAFGGSVTSAPAAVLTVNPIAPVILSAPPLAVTAVQGRSFLFGPITLNNTPATFTATGLTGAGTPDGLAVSSVLGSIAGTPVNTGTFSLVLTATNITGSDSRTISLTVQAPPPVITSPASVSGRVGTAFSFNVVATNSPTSYAATNLPAGLAINSGTGAITGTPTAAGTATVQLTATNSSGSVSQPLVIVINPPLNAPVYAGTLSPSGTQGTAFSFTPAFGTVTAPYALAGTLPTGLTFTAATGVVAGTPTQTGSFPVVLSATNAGGTTAVNLTFVVNAAATAPVITSSSIVPGARVGMAFSFQLTAAGTPAATSYGASTLPAGLSLAAGTGLITGTPTVFGSFDISVSATNSVGTGPAAILTLSLAPAASAPVITSSPVVNHGQVGQPFSFTLTASPAAVTFAVTSGTLPAGLALNAASGAITGTPLVAALGQTRVWFAGTNVSGSGLAMEVLFSIAPAASTPVVTSNGSAVAQVGQFFQYAIKATNGPLTAFAATNRPAWLALDANTGVLAGIPTEATSTPIVIALTATNLGGAGNPKNLALSVAPAPATPVIMSALTVSGRAGTAFTYQISASQTPTSFVATGLPPGLLLNSATGEITGSPTVANTFTVALRAANVGGLGAPATLVVEIAPGLSAPAITSAPSAAAQVGVAFSYQIVATNGPIVSFAADAKQLPIGLALNTATGVLSGTPSDDPRIYPIALTATNAGGTSLPQVLNLTLAPALGVPVVSTPLYVDATVGSGFSLTITASNLTGSAPYAPPIIFEAIGLPSGLAVNPATGTIEGRPTTVGSVLATLIATNASGTGPARDFTINVKPALAAPVVGGATIVIGQVNQPFTYQIVASNAPTSYEVLGGPAWIGLDSSSGAVTGTPTAPGTVSVKLTATNASGTSSPAGLDLFISPAANTPFVTSTRTAEGTVGSAFTYTPVATQVATSYTVSGLPGGLSFNFTSGAITGAPNVSGSFTVVLTPSNAIGVGAPAALTLTIKPNVTFGP